MTEGARVRIWIDLANSPHVLFFEPVIKELEKLGHEIVLTARDFAQTIDLARQKNLDVTIIGRNDGNSVGHKSRELLARAFSLAVFARRRGFDVAVSHNSYAQILAARLIGIPAVTLMDYEHQPANHLAFRLATKIIVPRTLPAAAVRRFGAGRSKIDHFDGLKEEVYLAGFEPDPDFLARLGVSRDTVLATVRPPAFNAIYHRFDNPLFSEALDWLTAQRNVTTIVLPRGDGALRRQGYPQPNVIIPERAIDAKNLIFYSDLVISGGGTMNREAAVLGTPAYTIFAGRMGAIDMELIDEGRLIWLREKQDLAKIAVTKKDGSRVRARPGLPSEIARKILDLAEAKQNRPVLLVEPFGHGGIAHYTFCLASALRAKALPVCLATADRYELADRADFPVKPLWRGPALLGPIIPKQLIKAAAFAVGVGRLRKEIKRRRPAAVHFQGGSVAFVDWFLAKACWPLIKRKGARVVYTAHNILPHKQKSLHRRLYRHIYKTADSIIVHAQANAKSLAELEPYHAPVKVIPHGDYSFLAAGRTWTKLDARRELGLEGQDKVILFFGAIMDYKGLDTLIKACGRLRRQVKDIKLLIVGDPRENFAKYQRLIDEQNLAEQVIKVLRYVAHDEIGLFFGAADVLALPYKATYQSGVIQLGFACGVPVVSSNVGALAELVDNNINGLLFAPPDNDRSLAECLENVLSDERLAEKLAAAGRQMAVDFFSWSEIADKTLPLY